MQVDRFDSPSDRSSADSDDQEETSQNDHMQVDEEPLAEVPAKETVDTKCPHCAKDLLHEAALKLHVKDSHKPTKCDKCDRVFEGRSRMSYHKVNLVPIIPTYPFLIIPETSTGQNPPGTEVLLSALSENVPPAQYLSAASGCAFQGRKLSV